MDNSAAILENSSVGAGDNSSVLRVTDLRKSYGTVRAVDGLTFSVPRGAIVGIIGPNGCGKTTSINCITGLERGFTGDVSVDGKSVVGLSPEDVARTGVMRSFQAIRIFDNFSVLRNTMIGLQCFDGLSLYDLVLRTPRFRRVEKETAEKAASLLNTVGLGAKIQDLAGDLSYGQKKLLALAGTLMSEPKIVILDEPVAGVNPTLAHKVAEILRKLNNNGTTFLIIEHNIEFIMNLAHGVVVMDHGRCLTTGSPAEIRADDRVLEAYLGGTDDAKS